MKESGWIISHGIVLPPSMYNSIHVLISVILLFAFEWVWQIIIRKVAVAIAKSVVDFIQPELIIDAFSGCGGNTIQFAKYCPGSFVIVCYQPYICIISLFINAFVSVISIEIDPIKIAMAKHNLEIYGIPSSRVTFIQGDVLETFKSLQFAKDYRV